ncbi:MAG: VOC family protein [Bacteroidia bacterium]|nr:VOC family protein [Bacteroidia bacterium]NNL79258.1 VOC family protein [Flavobacteriaceae bacterium]
MCAFKINFLDHVAIRVSDMEKSANWYQKVLGLKPYRFEAWGEFPVFLLSGKTGVALFPANLNDAELDQLSKHIKLDHFAFNVDHSEFLKAQEHFNHLDIPFEFQDHTYFHSIYLRDPDEHQVELTALIVDESEFYSQQCIN